MEIDWLPTSSQVRSHLWDRPFDGTANCAAETEERHAVLDGVPEIQGRGGGVVGRG